MSHSHWFPPTPLHPPGIYQEEASLYSLRVILHRLVSLSVPGCPSMAQQQYSGFSGIDGWISAWFNLCCCTSVCVKCHPWRNEWATPGGERNEGQQKWRVGRKNGKKHDAGTTEAGGEGELYTPALRMNSSAKAKRSAARKEWSRWEHLKPLGKQNGRQKHLQQHIITAGFQVKGVLFIFVDINLRVWVQQNYPILQKNYRFQEHIFPKLMSWKRSNLSDVH